MSDKVPSILSTIPWDSISEELKSIPTEIRVHLGPMINMLQSPRERQLDCTEKRIENLLTRIEACLDRTWETLNSGYWKDVPIEYRYCYSLCSIIKAVLLELQYEFSIKKSTEERIKVLKTIIQQVDKSILLGAPLSTTPDLLTTIASKLNEHCSQSLNASPKKIVINQENICDKLLPGFSPVNSYEKPSMESFYKNIFVPKNPAILNGCIDHWKALELWQDSDYLIKIAGNRTVPIEIGSRYTEEDWSQRLVNFSEFLQKHVAGSDKEIGYLAQHQLFDQIPELKDDFAVPDYCNFSDTEDLEQPDVNAWFGPAGTVSPLHYDPKNNLLCQVFGYKRVILYHPKDTNDLYPFDSRLLSNTAQVDPINPDYDKWPNFKKVAGLMCYLKPGETLYIPPKWWHHVTSLSPSFSVSFWWN